MLRRRPVGLQPSVFGTWSMSKERGDDSPRRHEGSETRSGRASYLSSDATNLYLWHMIVPVAAYASPSPRSPLSTLLKLSAPGRPNLFGRAFKAEYAQAG